MACYSPGSALAISYRGTGLTPGPESLPSAGANHGGRLSTGTRLKWGGVANSCHSRVIQNQQYLYPKFPLTVVVKLLRYSGSRVELRDGFSSHK